MGFIVRLWKINFLKNYNNNYYTSLFKNGFFEVALTSTPTRESNVNLDRRRKKKKKKKKSEKNASRVLCFDNN